MTGIQIFWTMYAMVGFGYFMGALTTETDNKACIFGLIWSSFIIGAVWPVFWGIEQWEK